MKLTSMISDFCFGGTCSLVGTDRSGHFIIFCYIIDHGKMGGSTIGVLNFALRGFYFQWFIITHAI